jgi:ubiquinone biosynthesis accessory factor UbiK
MFSSNQLDSLVKKLCATLPSSLQQVETDVHDTFKSILEAGFLQLDLVTREEFDAQVKVLARTREKVEALQKQLDNHQGNHLK